MYELETRSKMRDDDLYDTDDEFHGPFFTVLRPGIAGRVLRKLRAFEAMHLTHLATSSTAQVPKKEYLRGNQRLTTSSHCSRSSCNYAC